MKYLLLVLCGLVLPAGLAHAGDAVPAAPYVKSQAWPLPDCNPPSQ